MPDVEIKRALIAVYDKTGIADFAKALVGEFGVEIISTGGTARHLKEAGIPVTMVEEVTGFPEMLDGRVKTLHPKIHAAILADRDNPEHMRQLAEHDIKPIDMVVVNLYPFEETIKKPDCRFDEAIEMIDIGGPCLLRAAAKNHEHLLPVIGHRSYPRLLACLRDAEDVPTSFREHMARVAFHITARYDMHVTAYFAERLRGQFDAEEHAGGFETPILGPQHILRYGENPHQCGVFRPLLGSEGHEAASSSLVEMSFNNQVDANAALELCSELSRAQAPKTRQSALDTVEEPRTSVRAVHRRPLATETESILRPPDPRSPCWLLTWTTYGSWLPGDKRGFVSRAPRANGNHNVRNTPETPYDSGGVDLRESAKARMKGKAIELTAEHAALLAESFGESATTHSIGVIAFAMMPDHIHILCQSADHDGSRLLKLFKGAASHRLGQSFQLANAPRWWTEGGSKRYIKKGEDPAAAIDYVCSQERPWMVRCFDESRNVSLDTTSSAARTEVRGSSDEASPREKANVCCFIKHTNACGVAVDADPIEAYRRAYLGDPNAAMGGILAVNFNVDTTFAEAVMDSLSKWGKTAGAGAFFVEVLVTPSIEPEAVELIRTRKKWGERVRILTVGDMAGPPSTDKLDFKRIEGGMLAQTRDFIGLNEDQWKVVTDREPTDAEMADLRLAWLVCKHTKSNAITLCRDGMLIGNGAGQMSRIMSCRIATWLAAENGHAEKLKGAAAASDAFFPFRDGPDILADAGVTAIIQPGGSKRDADTIAACNERGLAMILTGTRHFKH
ncbi:MAG: transposase [Planctomycetota bacterium]